MSTIYIDPMNISGNPDSDERKLVKALNDDARKNFTSVEFRAAFAQALTQAIYWGFDHENLLSLMTTVENVEWGAPNPTVSEVRGLRAFAYGRNGYIEMSSIHQEIMDIQRDLIGFHVSDTVDKFRMNFSISQQEYITLGAQRLDAAINQAFLGLCQAAIPDNSSSSYVGISDLTLSALDDAITEVQDASYSDTVTVIGRASMINKIPSLVTGGNAFTAFLPDTNENILRSNKLLGDYKGANLVKLTNWKDDNNTAFFPGNELYVVGTDASKFAFWGGLEGEEWIEDGSGYWHYQAKREFGGIVHRPDRMRRIVATGQPSA